MVNLLDFPPELFYEGGADNGYERYMKDDPTGINHVLDEMYGAVFNLEEADFEESDPAFYMDWAYRHQATEIPTSFFADERCGGVLRRLYGCRALLVGMDGLRLAGAAG